MSRRSDYGLTIPAEVVDQAVRWSLQLDIARQSDSGSPEHLDQVVSAIERWCLLDAVHAAAWARVSGFHALIEPLTSAGAAAHQALKPAVRRSRRQLLNWAALAAVPSAGWWAWKLLSDSPLAMGQWDLAPAEFSPLKHPLADGSQATLAPQSSATVLFDRTQRLVRLNTGAIVIRTATAEGEVRPFRVQTLEVLIEALGTEFQVVREAGFTEVLLKEGRLKLTSPYLPEQILRAGERAVFSARPVVDRMSGFDRWAWTDGVVTVHEVELERLIAQWNRLSEVPLRCAPAACERRVSGTFQLHGKQAAHHSAVALGKTLGLPTERDGHGWVISAR